MKKLISAFLVLSLMFSFFSCGKSESKSQNTEEKKGDLEPLFTISPFDGKTCNTRFFPLEEGFVYATQTESGAEISYVNIGKSVSYERIFTVSGFTSLDEIKFFKSGDYAVISFGDSFYIMNPEKDTEKAGLYDKREFPENYATDFAVYDGAAFVYTDTQNKVAVLEVLDFSQKYVLAPQDALSGYDTPVSCDEKYIYFTKKTDSGFCGIMRLSYGTEKTLLLSDSEFDKIKLLGNSNILTKNKNDYRFVDISKGECIKYEVVRNYSYYAASDDFRYFAGVYEENGKEFVEIIDTDKSEVIKKAALGDFSCGGDIELSGDGKYLVLSLVNDSGDNKGEVISYISLG